MRVLRTAAICAALAGCGSPSGRDVGQFGTIPSPKTAWDITRKTDRMTDQPVTSITNTSKSAKITNKTGFTASILGISCDEKGPSSSFYWGFPVGRNGIAVLTYRFDSLPAQKPKAEFLTSEMVWISGQDARTFFQQLAGSSNLAVEIAAVTGVATAEFDTSGADLPLSHLATCLQASSAAQTEAKPQRAAKPKAQ